MRDRLLRLFGQTEAERTAYRNGLSLFFGALLGANLGFLQGMTLPQYVTAVALLAGTVMAFLLVGRARSRRYALATMAIYAAFLAYAYFRAGLFAGIASHSVDQLFVTLAMWIGAMAIVELTPLLPDSSRKELS
jgi:hypothetical protein